MKNQIRTSAQLVTPEFADYQELLLRSDFTTLQGSNDPTTPWHGTLFSTFCELSVLMVKQFFLAEVLQEQPRCF